MNSVGDSPEGEGCPIQKSPDQCSLSNSPELIAARHVFHRQFPPRHPPYALYSLTIKMLENFSLQGQINVPTLRSQQNCFWKYEVFKERN